MAAPRNDQQPGLFAVMKAVFWSFLGIRRRNDYSRDAVSLKPQHVVIAGIVGAVLLVIALILIVRVVVNR